jgi:type IV pilus assembly protein PilV
MLKTRTLKSRGGQQGSMLLEALIGILIFAVGVLALVGLQAATIANASDAKYRGEAAFFAQEMVSRLLLDQQTSAALLLYNNNPPSDWTDRIAKRLPSGTGALTIVIVDVNSQQPTATVTITWTPPGQTTAHVFSTTAAII